MELSIGDPFSSGSPSDKDSAARLASVASNAHALPEIVSGANPILRAANRLINLVPQLKAMAHAGDLVQLRERLASEVRLFERKALDASVSQEQVIGARYCLCTVLDETAMQTPWGSNGEWAQHSLLVLFHNETWGGEKFFQLLSRLAQNPQKHRDLLELMYFCIALGFEGRFRVIDNGRGQLETLRQRLASIIHTASGERDSVLSPHWRGVESQAQPWRVVPIWVVALLSGLVALVVFVLLSFLLADRSDPAFAKLAAIDVPIVQPKVKPLRRPDPVRLRQFLEPEIREGLVDVRDEPDRSVVTIMGDGLFDSGQAEINPRYTVVLQRVAAAMNEVPGTVIVAGYTDNVPSRSIRFPSNWHLSEARAKMVADMLALTLTDPSRIRAEGKGEAEPVADNGSSEGRARNRRVELTLLLPRSEIDRALNSDSTQGAN